MITLKEINQDNVVGFILRDEIDEDGMQKVIEALRAKTEHYPKLRLYGEVYGIKGWDTVKSFFSNIREKFQAFRKLEKMAMVTDIDWLEDLSEVAGFLTPGLDVESFDTDDKEEALIWLGKPTREETVNITMVELPMDNAVGFSIDGHLSKAAYDLVNEKMKVALEGNEKIGLYLEVIDLEGMTLKAVWEELKAAITYYNKLNKVVITGKEGWLKSAAKISDFLTPGIDVKYFSMDDKEEAMKWLA